MIRGNRLPVLALGAVVLLHLAAHCAAATSADVLPTNLKTNRGTNPLGNQPLVPNLSVQDQTGTQNNWNKYIEFKADYIGVFTFPVPEEARTKLTAITLVSNIMSEAYPRQKWQFWARNQAAKSWTYFGNTVDLPDWQWYNFVADLPATSDVNDYVNDRGLITLRFRLPKTFDRAGDMDYLALRFTYDGAVAPPPAPCDLVCGPNSAADSTCSACVCLPMWSGEFCDVCDLPCNAGTPSDDCQTCVCDAGWTGAACNVDTTTCTLSCGSNGSPAADCSSCSCLGGWTGAACNECGVTCNNGGAPNSACTGCVCVGSWTGSFCQTCSKACGANGSPTADCSGCTCSGSWTGMLCDSCGLQCNNGSPNNACTKCNCQSGWTGSSCLTEEVVTPPPPPPSGGATTAELYAAHGITTKSSWANLAWGWNNGGQDNQVDGARILDVDMFDMSAAEMAQHKAGGHTIICYFSAGTFEGWREDVQANFAAWNDVTIGQMAQWDEGWLDVSRLADVQALMIPRFQYGADKGCDGFEFDNLDCYDNTECRSKIAGGVRATVQAYNVVYAKWLADYARSLGKYSAFKNSMDIVAQVEPHYDMAMNEQCYQYSECGGYSAFFNAGKLVMNVEYKAQTATFCDSRKYASQVQAMWCNGSGSSGLCKQKTNGKDWVHCFAHEDLSAPVAGLAAATNSASGSSSSSSGGMSGGEAFGWFSFGAVTVAVIGAAVGIVGLVAAKHYRGKSPAGATALANHDDDHSDDHVDELNAAPRSPELPRTKTGRIKGMYRAASGELVPAPIEV